MPLPLTRNSLAFKAALQEAQKRHLKSTRKNFHFSFKLLLIEIQTH